MKDTVAVAMSGGVDSSVAALILKEQGFDVFGLTAVFMRPRQAVGISAEAVRDAARVCRTLGLKHVAVDLSAEFKRSVIAPFVKAYLSGRTPNPCVRCNTLMKFGLLLEEARSLGAAFFATGHYCRIEQRGRTRLLRKAKDTSKDQSYFLYRLSQPQLESVLFPLGAYRKEEVRRLAQVHGLSVFRKPDSQEICFLGDTDYRLFLKKRSAALVRPGQVVDGQGNVLGEHKGFPCYTIGQREGLGIAVGHPVHVVAIDPRANRIVVGSRREAYSREFLVTGLRWFIRAPNKKIAAKVRIRYNHKEAAAQVVPQGAGARVVFARPQFAVTPGQSAVFYDRDMVLGGGIIEKATG